MQFPREYPTQYYDDDPADAQRHHGRMDGFVGGKGRLGGSREENGANHQAAVIYPSEHNPPC